LLESIAKNKKLSHLFPSHNICEKKDSRFLLFLAVLLNVFVKSIIKPTTIKKLFNNLNNYSRK